MSASTVPVALERLGVERDLDAPFFGTADEEEAGHPELVAHGDAGLQSSSVWRSASSITKRAHARSDLAACQVSPNRGQGERRLHAQLPLSGHDLGIDAGDGDAGVEACSVVRLNQVAGENFASADTAVVRTCASSTLSTRTKATQTHPEDRGSHLWASRTERRRC